MAFYENTIIAKQDLPATELKKIKDKYNEIINNNSGKVVKVEEWGLLNLSKMINNYKKGFYIHYKFEGNSQTLNEISKKIKMDNLIIRNLVVKYKQLDLKNSILKMKRNNKKFKKRSDNSLSRLSLFKKVTLCFQKNVLYL